MPFGSTLIYRWPTTYHPGPRWNLMLVWTEVLYPKIGWLLQNGVFSEIRPSLLKFSPVFAKRLMGCLLGGVAQLLGSLCGLSCPKPDLWLTGNRFVGNMSTRSANQANTAFHLSRDRQISSNQLICMDHGGLHSGDL